MAEFKKLSEVEQVDSASDTATVLIEEGGEIKRVAKSEVGGAGGYIIKLENSYIDADGMFRFEESYDELYDVLIAGGSVWVDYTNSPEPEASALVGPASSGFWSATNRGAAQYPVLMWMITDVGLGLMDTNGMMNDDINIYYPNGSHNLEPNESLPS